MATKSTRSEQVDPVYKYIDSKINSLRLEIRRLTITQLVTARILAALAVNQQVTSLAPLIKRKRSLMKQLLANASKSKVEIMSSKDPVAIAEDFSAKWKKIADKLAPNAIDY